MHVRILGTLTGTEGSSTLRRERRSQKSSKHPLSRKQRRAMIALAPAHGPMHAGSLEVGADGDFVSCLDHPRRDRTINAAKRQASKFIEKLEPR